MTGKDDPLTRKDAPVTEKDSAAKDGMAHRSALPALKAMCEGASTRMKWGAVLAAVTVLAGMGLLGLCAGLRCLRTICRHPTAGAGPHRVALRRAARHP